MTARVPPMQYRPPLVVVGDIQELVFRRLSLGPRGGASILRVPVSPPRHHNDKELSLPYKQLGSLRIRLYICRVSSAGW